MWVVICGYAARVSKMSDLARQQTFAVQRDGP